ncbi:MAG: 2-hydroxyacyl-CoA dehydratase family protein [Pseudomonadota bacterium]
MTPPLEIPSRSQVMRELTGQGQRLAAVYPIHYPRALLRAFGFSPVEVWGPPQVDPDKGNAHLQAYVCSVVRNGLSFVLDGKLDGTELIVVPHCCDSLQGLGSLLMDFVAPRQPVLPLYLPRGRRPLDLDFFENELAAMALRLREITGQQPDDRSLREAQEREEEADALLIRLHAERLHLSLDDALFYRLVRSREYLPAEQFSPIARRALELRELREKPGLGVILSGILPEPPELLETLRQAGARVVGDDLACTGRRLYPAGRSERPLRRMAESLLGGPPDPMLGASIAERGEALQAMARRGQARGVIFHSIKFCEPELFDQPQLKTLLEAGGLATLSIEHDLNDSLPMQVATRIEAFVEMLS